MRWIGYLLPSGFVRSLFFAGVLCILVPPAGAQIDVKVGFKEGGNFATLGGANAKQATAPTQSGGSLNRRPGLIIGGLVAFEPSGPVGLQSEALWIWKGAKVLTGQSEAVTKINYLEVPLLAKYQTPVTWGEVTTHLLAGPTFAYATKAQRELKATDAQGQSRFVNSTVLDGPTRNVEIGIAAGGEIGYDFSDQATITVGARYRRGLTRVFGESAGTNSSSSLDAWHEGFAITLGFVYSSGWSFSLN